MQELFWLVERNAPTLGVYNVAEQWEIAGPVDLRRAASRARCARRAARGAPHDHRRPRRRTGAGDRRAAPVPLDLVDLAALAPEAQRRRAAPHGRRAERAAVRSRGGFAAARHARPPGARRARAPPRSAPPGLRRLVARHLHARARRALRAGAGERARRCRPSAVRLPTTPRGSVAGSTPGANAPGAAIWLTGCAGSTLAVALPTDRPRPRVADVRGRQADRRLPSELLERLRRLARDERRTLFMVLLAGFETLLHRYSGQSTSSSAPSSPAADAPSSEVIVGNFVNYGPASRLVRRRSDLPRPARAGEGRVPPRERARRAAVRDAERRGAARARRGEAAGFAQVHFVLQNNASGGLRLSAARDARAVTTEATTTKFDLSLSMGEQSNGLRAAMQYRLARCSTRRRSTACSAISACCSTAASAAPHAPVSALPMLSAGEGRRTLVEWNGTAT